MIGSAKGSALWPTSRQIACHLPGVWPEFRQTLQGSARPAEIDLQPRASRMSWIIAIIVSGADALRSRFTTAFATAS